MLSIEYLKEKYTYHDGNLINLKGKCIGFFDKSTKYRRVKIKNKTYLMHRLIFAYHNGYYPDMIDHINQNKLDNRIENLRECPTRGYNTINSPARSDNTSGYKGVTWHKSSKKWHSSLFKQGKRHYLGVYDDIHEAAKVYNEKAKEMFGDFAELNLIKEKRI